VVVREQGVHQHHGREARELRDVARGPIGRLDQVDVADDLQRLVRMSGRAGQGFDRDLDGALSLGVREGPLGQDHRDLGVVRGEHRRLAPVVPELDREGAGGGLLVGFRQLGGRPDPSIGRGRRETVQERAARERAEVSGPERRRRIDHGDREAGAECARPNRHGRGSSRSIGLVA
jgi:hypothetical protein